MKLTQERLQNLYPSMEKTFAQQMEQMIHMFPVQKEKQTTKRWMLRTMLIGALVAVLCMATAYAVIQYGLDWYYRTRFTAYQEHEPEKHAAIMNHLQSGLSQTVTGDALIDIQVKEAAWVPDERTMVVALTATPKDGQTHELHPMWNLDADGAYVGEGGAENPASDGEDRAVHWLWTQDGFGPVKQMIAPGKQLLLLEVGDVYLNGNLMLGDGGSMDSFVAEDGVVHTVLEIRLDMLAEGYEEAIRQRIADQPDNARYLGKSLAANLETRRFIEQDADGVVTFTVPFTTTPYTEDDQQLYQGGHQGSIAFDVKIK